MKNNPPEYTDEPQLEIVKDSEEEKKREKEIEDFIAREEILKTLK